MSSLTIEDPFLIVKKKFFPIAASQMSVNHNELKAKDSNSNSYWLGGRTPRPRSKLEEASLSHLILRGK